MPGGAGPDRRSVTSSPSGDVNASIGARRTLLGHAAAIEPLLEVKRAQQSTLNDVALAVVAGALRHLAWRAPPSQSTCTGRSSAWRRSPRRRGPSREQVSSVLELCGRAARRAARRRVAA